MGSGGPLGHLRVVELAGIGPGPFAAMLLADLGATVLRVDRRVAGSPAIAAADGAQSGAPAGHDVLARSRRSIAVDLKRPEGAEVVLRLLAHADALLEGFRPGVAERLGVGPEAALARNPGLVYGRMTGWGQSGPWAAMAGHDIDYAALAGALHPIGPADRPPPVPLNLVADFGGGGMLLVVGVLAALAERDRSGRGQVVDAAMVDGAATLSAMVHGLLSQGLWTDRRSANLLDGAAPFYRTYAAADGRFVAVGALEAGFYAALLEGLGLVLHDWPQHQRSRWPALHAELERRFAAEPRAHWEAVFAGSDACVAPVLSLAEAPLHPHLLARGTFTEVDGVAQPAPAPRFSRTPPGAPTAPPAPGTDTAAVLAEAGFDAEEVAALHAAGVVGSPA